MSYLEPTVPKAFPPGSIPPGSISIPGTLGRCRGPLVERDRLQWSAGSGDDPAERLADFLAAHGLPVADLARPVPDGAHGPGDPCGAAVLISAAAGALMTDAPPGPATPAPGIPDLVAIVYAHPRDHAHPEVPAARTSTTGPPVPWWVGPWRASWSPADHARAVRRARAAIARGDVYQVALVGHSAARCAGDPVPALTRLAALPGARYGGVLSGAGWAVGCASPETLVAVAGGRLLTRPIKGTRPATAAGHRELLTSGKERAEHVMIVDLERNDVARVARTGSVQVDELYAIRRWCGLWQAESTVSADVAPGAGLVELLRALCPGGSVTGAPKLAALGQIAALEPVGRGPSMGAFGWIGAGRVDLGLTIRTAAVADATLHLWAGGGITWGSDPDAEVAEAAAKAAPLRAALSPSATRAGPTR
jgi:para-aminobenzoate synthetase component 1